MRVSTDRTGFPLMALPEAGLEVALLPVAKVQFERFLATNEGMGDAWYEAVLALHPRMSWRCFSDDDRERLFVGGVLPEEALRFARWMGQGFDIPTVEEWRTAHRALAREAVTGSQLGRLARPADQILQGLEKQLQPKEMLGLSLMRGGMVEWVREGNRWCGVGCPRPSLCPNVWNPLADVVRPIRPADRLPYFGFRLVRRTR